MGSYGKTRQRKKKNRKFVVQKAVAKTVTETPLAVTPEQVAVAAPEKSKIKRAAAPKKKTAEKKEAKPKKAEKKEEEGGQPTA